MHNRWRTLAFITLGAFGIVVADTLILRSRLAKLECSILQADIHKMKEAYKTYEGYKPREYRCKDCGIYPDNYRHCVPNAKGDDYDVYCMECTKKRFPNHRIDLL